MNPSELDRMDAEIDSLLIGNSDAIDRYSDETFTDCVKPVTAFRQDVIDHLFGEKVSHGFATPWSMLTGRFMFRPGELTIWSGPSGEGKSLITSQCMLSVAGQGGKSVVASLELHPYETIARMTMQHHGYDRPLLSEDLVHSFIDAIHPKLWLYAETGDVPTKRVLALARYVRAELGADAFVIDSMVKCGIRDADYASEKEFVSSLQNIAKQSGLHIHLVTHKKKGGEYGMMMRKEDISGTQKITDLADNVILVQRNRRKEEESMKTNPNPEIMEKPDTWMRIDKQRHGDGWEGTIGLWFTSGWRFVKKGL